MAETSAREIFYRTSCRCKGLKASIGCSCMRRARWRRAAMHALAWTASLPQCGHSHPHTHEVPAVLSRAYKIKLRLHSVGLLRQQQR